MSTYITSKKQPSWTQKSFMVASSFICLSGLTFAMTCYPIMATALPTPTYIQHTPTTQTFVTQTHRHDHRPWIWPIATPHHVLRAFDPPAMPWLAGHRGVDLAVSCGQTIYAPADGRVTISRSIVNVDTVVMVHDHRRSTFSPAQALVELDTPISAGTPIATINTNCEGILNWGVKIDRKKYLNPLEQLVGTIVLKPWNETY